MIFEVTLPLLDERELSPNIWREVFLASSMSYDVLRGALSCGRPRARTASWFEVVCGDCRRRKSSIGVVSTSSDEVKMGVRGRGVWAFTRPYVFMLLSGALKLIRLS